MGGYELAREVFWNRVAGSNPDANIFFFNSRHCDLGKSARTVLSPWRMTQAHSY